jgi:hypothetical protein
MFDNFRQYYGLNEIEIPEALHEYYNLLTDPFNDLCFMRYGFFDDEIKERIALEKIVDADDTEIIKHIIASPNPEGRMYGIEILLENGLNEENNKIINKFIELKIPIIAVYGDIAKNIIVNTYEKILEAVNFTKRGD